MSFFVTASIEQLSWQDVRDIVAIENPLLAEIIDEISPGKDFPIILETAVAPSRVILANAGIQSKRALALNIGLIKHNHLFGERCFMNLTAQENMP